MPAKADVIELMPAGSTLIRYETDKDLVRMSIHNDCLKSSSIPIFISKMRLRGYFLEDTAVSSFGKTTLKFVFTNGILYIMFHTKPSQQALETLFE
jgi:hypothetical protein